MYNEVHTLGSPCLGICEPVQRACEPANDRSAARWGKDRVSGTRTEVCRHIGEREGGEMQVPGEMSRRASQNKSKQGKADMGAAGTAGRPLIDPCHCPANLPVAQYVRSPSVRLAVDGCDEGSVWMPWPLGGCYTAAFSKKGNDTFVSTSSSSLDTLLIPLSVTKRGATSADRQLDKRRRGAVPLVSRPLRLA
ncbi:hypothetical protein VTN00DRAFT_2283 [Thermoascus crustaceus]|uniref:uncharacterized protein n=1 Tax=Thermoascus crustaceus TaxID=5088 RepID=UPI003743699C